jgi:dienelactone hydrolase
MKTETVEYRSGATAMRGYLAYDETRAGKRPGVLVCHDILGLGPDPKRRANMLAELGYVALAVDMYGDGKQPKDFPEGRGWLMALMNNRAELRGRVNAAREALGGNARVDGTKLAAIGYCFGGAVVLELARSGAPVKGVVSFHGGLNTPNPADAKNIKAKVLVCHGSEDPIVPPPEVDAFIKEMRESGCDWQFVSYGKTLHSFTNPAVDGMSNPAAKYNADSDRRSWKLMRDFFDEIFA